MSPARVRSEDAVVYAQRFAAWLRDRRRRSGMSQTQIAAVLGVHRNSVDRWEHGGSAVPAFHADTLRRFFTPIRSGAGVREREAA